MKISLFFWYIILTTPLNKQSKQANKQEQCTYILYKCKCNAHSSNYQNKRAILELKMRNFSFKQDTWNSNKQLQCIFKQHKMNQCINAQGATPNPIQFSNKTIISKHSKQRNSIQTQWKSINIPSSHHLLLLPLLLSIHITIKKYNISTNF